jgi:hypothetical protein
MCEIKPAQDVRSPPSPPDNWEIANRAQLAFRTSSAALVAHNFTMPALSPTMTEGNIASWKVKEGIFLELRTFGVVVE